MRHEKRHNTATALDDGIRTEFSEEASTARWIEKLTEVKPPRPCYVVPQITHNVHDHNVERRSAGW